MEIMWVAMVPSVIWNLPVILNVWRYMEFLLFIHSLHVKIICDWYFKLISQSVFGAKGD